MNRRTSDQQMNHFSRTLERGRGGSKPDFVCRSPVERQPLRSRYDCSPHRIGRIGGARNDGADAHTLLRLGFLLTASSCSPCISTMTDKPPRQKGRKAIPALNMAINGLNVLKEATSTTPVNSVFGSVALLLTMIRVSSLSLRDEMFRAHA